MASARLRLPDVTLVAIDTIAHALTAVALHECLKRAEFNAAIVLSDRPIDVLDVRWIKSEPISSVHEASKALWYDIPKHVETSHLLLIQWDSWIINPAMWCEQYLRYDYVGAPWWWYRDGLNVGNGGFSLRSMRLAEFLLRERHSLPCLDPEDSTLCRKYRRVLEAEGFSFAPDVLAACFSAERSWLPFDSFGFHGMYNWPRVLTADAIAARLAIAPPYVLNSLHFAQMREIMQGSKCNPA